MAQVKSTIKLNMPRVKRLDKAAVRALEKTAETLRTEIVQAQVIPRMDGVLQGEKTHIKAGQSVTGTYENGDKVTNSISKAHNGHISMITEGPQARRLYYHPEYNFQKEPWEEDVKNKDGTTSHLTHEGNPNAKGKWFEDWLPGGSQEEFAGQAFKKFYKREAGV